MEYESVIGLEVHAQLSTESKIFSSSSSKFGASPNSHVNPLCLGLPGVLPVLNKRTLEYAIKAGIATSCEIASKSRFARKNYFYPDLPKGYQISQYEDPLCVNGYLNIDSNGSTKKIRITRIHMEEDAGKLIHDLSPRESYVDLNRAGVPLIEIVSEPDIENPEQAVSYVKKLRSILRYLEICDGNMEEGSLRCDANVSIRPKGEKELGTKTEIKNLNSFKFIQKALEYEINRQIASVEHGDKIIQETRLFDSKKGSTFPMRSKEEAHDYRYFPDPDLLTVTLDEQWINDLRNELPELPDLRLKRFVEEYSLPKSDAELLISSKELADYYEECLNDFSNPKELSNWIITELLRELKDEETITEFPVTPKMLAELLNNISDGTISRKIAKEIFPEMIKNSKPAEDIISERGLKQISDQSELEAVIKEILNNHPDEVSRYNSGEEKLLGFFVGQIMKSTKGKANPKIVNELLRKLL